MSQGLCKIREQSIYDLLQQKQGESRSEKHHNKAEPAETLGIKVDRLIQ